MAYGNPSRRLYVLQVTGGIVKAGIARGSGLQRVEQHRYKLGANLLDHFIADQYVTGVDAERELLIRLAKVGSLVRGREWFAGVAFADAIAITKEVAVQFAALDQSPVPSPLLRKSYAKLSFSDEEIAVLDAYCARFGVSRAKACRDLAVAAVVDHLGAPA